MLQPSVPNSAATHPVAYHIKHIAVLHENVLVATFAPTALPDAIALAQVLSRALRDRFTVEQWVVSTHLAPVHRWIPLYSVDPISIAPGYRTIAYPNKLAPEVLANHRTSADDTMARLA